MLKACVPVALLLLSACAGRPSGPAQVGVYQPQPTVAKPAPIVPTDYRIGPRDELRIDVFGEPELSLKELPVNTSGTIEIPLAGSVKASGRTASELSADIARLLDRYLRNPQVAVNVTKFTSQRITVTGSVEKSGIFDEVIHPSLLDAIALAGGLNDNGREDEIIVLRTNADGSRAIARFDLRLIQAGSMTNPALQNGDVVVVGTSNARRLLGYAVALVPAAAGVFIALANNF